MIRALHLAAALAFLAACQYPIDHFEIGGAPVPLGAERLDAMALAHRPCVKRIHGCFGGALTFHDGPFDCRTAGGLPPGSLCEATAIVGQIDVDGNLPTCSKLPREFAHILVQCCDGDSSDTPEVDRLEALIRADCLAAGF